jgi:hypothetical protein
MSVRIAVAMAAVCMMVSTVFVGIACADETSKEDGTSTADAFGPGSLAGWDYSKVKSPSGDSWIAVVWGKGTTAATRGEIWIVGMWTRYLGVAKVYDQNGALISRSKPLAVRGYFMQRFNAIYEFNDSNGDGIANVIRSNGPISPAQVIAHEPVYKAVSLRTAWQKTNATEGNTTVDGSPAKLWEMTLTAHDLPYIVIGNSSLVNQSVGDWKLNTVSFTFHLTGWREDMNVSVPQFNITVNRTDPASPKLNTTQAGTKVFSANLTKVRTKEDHSIEGWDFDPSNANPGLVLETNIAYGYFLWSRAPAWLAAAYIEKNLMGAGKVDYKPAGAASDLTIDGGNDSLPDADGAANASDTVDKVGSDRRLEFGGNWEKEQALTWTSGTSVWANDTAAPTNGTVSFQVQGARRFAWNLGPMGGLKFIGVYLMGGFSYTGSGPFYKVEHDPQTDTEMGDVEIPDQDNIPPTARATGPSADTSYMDTVTLNASGSSAAYGGALSYKWSEGSNVLGTGQSLSQTFPVGSHKVVLSVDDGVASNTTTVTFNVVNLKPNAKIAALSKNKYMTGDTIKLDGFGSSDPESGLLTYKWTEGTKLLGTDKTLAKSYSTGTHTVTLTVTDPKDGTDSATATFTVEEKKSPGFEALFAVFGIGAALVLLSRRSR